MADDWFRNEHWDDNVARRFEEKLRRARRKEQYLRIQACTLASTHPAIALELLDRYFSMSDKFDHAQAYVDRATALKAVGRLEEAADAYEAALAREAEFPNLLTRAYLELPVLIAAEGLRSRFERAIAVLDAQADRRSIVLCSGTSRRWGPDNPALHLTRFAPQVNPVSLEQMTQGRQVYVAHLA